MIEDRPLKYIEADLPAPESTEIRLRVTAFGVRRTELHVIDSHGGQHVSVAEVNDALVTLKNEGIKGPAVPTP